MRQPSHRRRGEHGFSLIELLLGLALLALLASFIAGGFVFSRRAFALDRIADRGEEADAAGQTLVDLLASALPIATGKEKTRSMVFEGQPAGVSFVGLSTAHGMRGGLQAIAVSLEEGRLVADVRTTQGEGEQPKQGEDRQVVLLAHVRRADFSFFGRKDGQAAPAWQSSWSGASSMPLAVSLHLAFDDDRRPPSDIVVALRQR